MRIWVLFFAFLVLSLFPASYQGNTYPPELTGGYFDPHNHYDGILPWQAYVNLSAFANDIDFTFDEALNLYLFLNASFYPMEEEKIPLYTMDSRLSAGASGTFLIYQNLTEFEETPSILYGALERVLSTTPFTEFDSGYNLRALIVDSDNTTCYSATHIYDGDISQLNKDECTATLSDLEQTNVTYSEQIIVLNNNEWTSRNQCILRCLATNPGKPHKILLMALGNRLAYTDDSHYQSWDNPTQQCKSTPWSEVTPYTVDLSSEANDFIASFNTYLDGTGECRDDLANLDQLDIWETLVGVDHAGPELTCYTEEGMEYFKHISWNMMNEVQWRSKQGKWDGKPLLHHVHTGEGFSLYYDNLINVETATFSSVFGQLPGYGPIPNFRTNTEVPKRNVRLIVNAIDEMATQDEDIVGTVVFRMGHVTHVDAETADMIADLHSRHPGLVEADINIESNIMTHAYAVIGVDLNNMLRDMLADRETNFEVNQLSRVLIPDPNDIEQVGLILGNFTALKYLLTSGAPVNLPIILGTDGTGSEHSPMSRQHELAKSLITYWSQIDPEFAALEIPMDYFDDSSSAHFVAMTTDNWGLGAGAVAGIIIGCVLVFAVILGVIALVWKAQSSKESDYGMMNNDSDYYDSDNE